MKPQPGLCLLLVYVFLQYGDCIALKKDCRLVKCKPCAEQQQVQASNNECCHPCTPHCICPAYLECLQEGYKDGILPIGKSVYKDFGTQKCTSISANIICTSTCPAIPPTCKYIERPMDGCGMCACPIEDDHFNFVPAGETRETECKICKCPPDGRKLQCTPVSKDVKCSLEQNNIWGTGIYRVHY